MLIDAGGYPKIVDFGFANILGGAMAPGVAAVTFTVLGTPEYLCPEVGCGVSVTIAWGAV